MVSSTPRPHFTPRKEPVPILQKAGWAPGPVWTGGKSRPHRNSIPDRPACSQSLYRLSYRAHIPTGGTDVKSLPDFVRIWSNAVDIRAQHVQNSARDNVRFFLKYKRVQEYTRTLSEHFKCREQMIILFCKVLTLLVSNSVVHETLRNAVDVCVCVRACL